MAVDPSVRQAKSLGRNCRIIMILRPAILILSLAVLFAVSPAHARNNKARRSHNKYHRLWRTRARECEALCGQRLALDEAQNCIHRCTSPRCFEEVYGENPLEDGEVDNPRRRAFSACLTREQRQLAAEDRRQRREPGTPDQARRTGKNPPPTQFSFFLCDVFVYDISSRKPQNISSLAHTKEGNFLLPF